jgi:hypothetical protein
MNERKDLEFHLDQIQSCIAAIGHNAEVHLGRQRNWGNTTAEKRKNNVQRINDQISRHVKIIKAMLQDYRESNNESD